MDDNKEFHDTADLVENTQTQNVNSFRETIILLYLNYRIPRNDVEQSREKLSENAEMRHPEVIKFQLDFEQ